MIVSGMAPVSRFPALPQPMRAAMALRAGVMDHALRRAAGDGHVPANPQMIGSGFFAEDGFHPAGETVRGQAQSQDRSPGQWHPGGCRGDAPDGTTVAWLPGFRVLIARAAPQRRVRSRPGLASGAG